MTYIQLSLYGIPAIVRHGNSLTMQSWSQWLTPVYIMGGWSLWPWWNDPDAKQEGGEPAADVRPSPPDVAEVGTVGTELDSALHETKHGQISLF
jgi:hypothetical protein